MKHLDTIDAEFTRQAATFAGSETLKADDVTARIGTALGDLPDQRVLDVACGPGILTNVLAARAAATVGIDFTAETLRRATTGVAEGQPSTFVRGLAEVAPFRPRSFGGAVIRLALHHFEDPGAVLQEVHRVLVPGGRLVVLDILTSPDTNAARLHNAIERLRDPSHTRFWSNDALRRMIEAAGFDVSSAQTWDKPRGFSDWAGVVNAPKRMAALEVLLEQLARAGETAGIELRLERGKVRFTYSWSLIVAHASTRRA